MRAALVNGNGSICDRCYADLYSRDVIHIQAKTLHPEESKAYTGHTITIGKMDLCKDCYEELQRIFIGFKEPRK